MNSSEGTVKQILSETKEERDFENSLGEVSPFEVKNLLLSYAKDDNKKSARTLLNAGRGNPNWICTLPREAFYLLGEFGIGEAKRTMSLPSYDLAGMPEKVGSGERFREFLKAHGKSDAAEFLSKCFDWCTSHGMDADSVAMEWAEGMNGCEYPVPERILENTQKIIEAYISQEMFGGEKPTAPFELFATEGGTAAMCYLFYSLKCNFLANPGDKIALMTPIFTPYLQIPPLNDYDLDVVYINADSMDNDGLHAWQYPDSEIEKLADPSIKLLCLVNPSNPPSYAMSEESHKKLIEVVKEKNPNLLIITDDVYGTFVQNYRSVFADLPQNTALVYSFSKYFGATGWRLAVIAMAQENKFDELIAALPEEKKKVLVSRYSCLTNDIQHEKFIDRMVADSRLVALNGTAGLSTPQQILMSLFALHSLLDTENAYKNEMQKIIAERYNDLWNSMGITMKPDPLRAGYYSIIDLGLWAERLYGADFKEWLQSNYDSLDIVIRLAKDTGVVVMDGHGFDAPLWSIRVSLANLKVEDYLQIGSHIKSMLADYADAWKQETSKSS